VEECAVLVIGEGVVYFLVPYHTSVRGRDVDQLDPECISHEIIREDSGALETSVRPSVAVRIGDVQTSDRDGLYFVRRLWDRALDRLLIVI
jgi:hypothetical protein